MNPWDVQAVPGRQGPIFKKPQVYDPGLAERTMAQAINEKTKHNALLASMGLADAEGIDVDDDDDEIEMGEDGKELALHHGGGAYGLGCGGADDHELQEQRARSIAKQGQDQYRMELAGRAAAARLQEVSPATRTTIAALMIEVQMLSKENKDLHALAGSHTRSSSNDGHNSAVLEQYEEDIHELRDRVQQLEQSLAQRDTTITQLRSQLDAQILKSPRTGSRDHAALQQPAGDVHTGAAAAAGAAGLAGAAVGAGVTAVANGHSHHNQSDEQVAALQKQVTELQAHMAGYEQSLAAKAAANAALSAQLFEATHASSNKALGASAAHADRTAQLEALQAALSHKESRLNEAMAELADLRKSGAVSSAEAAAAGGAALQQATAARGAAEDRAAALEGQLQAARQEVSGREAHWEAKVKEAAAGGDGQQAAALQAQLWDVQRQHTQRVEELEAELKLKAALVTQLQAQKSDAVKQADNATAKVKQVERTAAAAVEAKLKNIQAALAELHDFREGVLGDLVAMRNDMFTDKMQTQMVRMVRDKEVAAVRRVKADMQVEVAAAQQKASDAADQVDIVRHKFEQQLRITELEAQGQIKLFKDKWALEFDKRKKLHNMVLELKGSIRVLCRIRPLLEKEVANLDNGTVPVKALTEESVRVAAVDKVDKDFEFDRVFASTEGQETVFAEVEALVTSVLDGYNVCIMAYGQTGSGKTFTMEGPDGDPGVNLRALEELFKLAADRSQDWGYKFSASVLEIYNEQIYDLLAGGRDQDGDKLDVKQGPEGMHVPGLRVEDVASLEDVAAVIRRGKNNRSTFATNMNEHSSRSHLVLSVYITATPTGKGVGLRGKLHLIDLAGSERIARTGAQGDRLKEAQNINKSLSALGDVIQALQQRNSHIPYRNSKLTRLLEDSLGSSSKCVMVVNVSPAAENVPETKCSLEFASRARKVELGKARQTLDAPSPTYPIGTPPPPRPLSALSQKSTPAGTPESLSRNSSRGNLRTSSAR